MSRVHFSPDGRRLASISGYHHGQTLCVWQLPSGRLERTFTYKDATVTLSPDWKCLVYVDTTNQARIQLLQFPGGHPLTSVTTDTLGVLAVSPQSQTLVCGGKDGRIRLWRVSDGSLVRVLDGHKYRVTALAFSADGKFLASGGADRTVRLWSASDGKLVNVFGEHGGRVLSVTFSARGEVLASGGDTGTIHLSRIADSNPLRKLRYGDGVTGLAFSSDSTLLAACGTSDAGPTPSLFLWRVSDGKLLQILMHEMEVACCVAFSPERKLLAAGCTDGTIRLFSPGGLKEEQDPEKVDPEKGRWGQSLNSE